MPNFDGNGPLKRGRVIGRGRGPCGRSGRELEEPDLSDGPGPENRKPRKPGA